MDKQAILASRDIELLNEAWKESLITLDEYKQRLGELATTMGTITQGARAANSAIQTINSGFADTMNILAGGIDQQVAYYQAQIKAIQTQNLLTQATALQSAATQIYGANSLQASRATTSLNYVQALYTQAVKNRTVAEEQWYTAIPTQLISMAASVTATIGQLITLKFMYNVLQQQHQANAVAAGEATTSTSALVAALGALTDVEATAAATAGMGAADMAVEDVAEMAPWFLLGAQGGGQVKRSGWAYVHGGESINTAGTKMGGSSRGPNVNINVYATSNVDLPRVRQEIQSALARSWYEGSKQRGVY